MFLGIDFENLVANDKVVGSCGKTGVIAVDDGKKLSRNSSDDLFEGVSDEIDKLERLRLWIY